MTRLRRGSQIETQDEKITDQDETPAPRLAAIDFISLTADKLNIKMRKLKFQDETTHKADCKANTNFRKSLFMYGIK